MAERFPYLIELAQESTAGLRGISLRRLFGCDALFVGEHIFVLFWKTGRIGVKLLDPADHAALLALPGAEAWRMGPKVAAHWVLVPEDMHDDGDALTPWIRKAYAQVRAAPAKKVAKVAKSAAKVAKSAAKVTRPAKVVAKATKKPVARATKKVTKKATKVGAGRAAGR
jgi:TfoX/Sxy family transcriptional regulator of competence genes